MTDIPEHSKPLHSSPNESIDQPAEEEAKPIRYRQTLFMGSLLPGQSTSVSYSLEEVRNSVQFVTAQLSNSAVAQGFSLSKNSNSEQKVVINLVLKSKATQKIVIHIFAQNVTESTEIRGTLKLVIGKDSFSVTLMVRIEVPRIFCPKFLHNQPQGVNMLRIIINKLATNEGRISLMNTEKYPMQFQAEIVGKSLIDKDCPFNISCSSSVITASPQKPFMFTVSIATNIFFKGAMNNLKKVVCRKLILLKTNSSVIYTIPLEVIIVFVKQPEIKE